MIENICVFGDSIAKGVVYNPERNRYTVIDSSFAKLFVDTTGINVNNYSKFGCTIEKGFSIIENHIDDIVTCDCVVLEFGGNDCDYNWSNIAENPNGEYLCQTPLKAFVETYKKIITKMTSLGKQVIILNLPPLDAKKYFNWVSRDKNAENIKKWLGGSIDFIYRWHEMYNMAVSNIAKQMNIRLIDLRSEFLGNRNYSNLICDDGIHPNAMGHKLIFNVINTAYSSKLLF